MRALLNDDTKSGTYAVAVLSKIINYCAFCIPEVSSTVPDIVDALRMGNTWNEGPLDLLNDYALERYIHRLQDEGADLPEFLSTKARLKQEHYDSPTSRSNNHESGMKFINRGEGVRPFGDHKKYAQHISRNYAATIGQFTDDARKPRLLVSEFHSKAHALQSDALKILEEAIARLESDDYQGLIVNNEAMNFSAGADLNTMIDLEDRADWTEIDKYLSHCRRVWLTMRNN